MADIPTVKIVDPQKPGDYIIINVDDFKEGKHTLFPGESLPDTQLSLSREKRNTETYYQACKDEVRQQDELRREFSVKTSGILTFCVASLGVAVTLLDSGAIPNTLLAIMGWSLAVIVVLGAYILSPSIWPSAFSVSHLREKLRHYEPENLIRGMGIAQEDAITKSSRKIRNRGMALVLIVIAAVVQTLAFIACLIYPCLPFVR